MDPGVRRGDVSHLEWLRWGEEMPQRGTAYQLKATPWVQPPELALPKSKRFEAGLNIVRINSQHVGNFKARAEDKGIRARHEKDDGDKPQHGHRRDPLRQNPHVGWQIRVNRAKTVKARNWQHV